ncbi:MAG: P1 family peptidase [Herpetosiphon sp.]
MSDMEEQRCRFRDLGLSAGTLLPGPLNAITDVAGVAVGHVTAMRGDNVRTGATAILAHGGCLYHNPVPAAVVVGNGFGKLMGSTQVGELGEIETPVVLTNTLAAPRAADAILDWVLSQPGHEQITTVNPVVGETNDSYLNDIRQRILTTADIRCAIEGASSGVVAEGAVGAGTGTVAFGWKGGIGTSSRVVAAEAGGYVVGVLVQSNFGGELMMAGVPVGKLLAVPREDELDSQARPDGSIMIVVATDAPLSDRSLTRLARRALAGLARTGSNFANGSGDYVIAFSSHGDVRRHRGAGAGVRWVLDLHNDTMTPLFQAVIEATEEAIYNSLCMATTMRGHQGHRVAALPLDQLRKALRGYRPIASAE